MLTYPAILYPADDNGLHGCAVPDLLIAASGASQTEALEDAANIATELLSKATNDGEAFPEPSAAGDIDLDGGTLVLIVPLPGARAA